MLLKTYTPHPRFPAISLSGSACEMRCRHCNAAYLGGMLAAETPAALLEIARRLQAEGAVGALLSGGSDHRARILNLDRLLDAVRQVKAETDLILNLHPGLLDAETARALAVDFVSLEIPDDEIIHEVFNFDGSVTDYWDTYRYLSDAGLEVVPHVSVYTGDEDKLLHPLTSLGLDTPEVIVVIVFSPTAGTAMADVPPPTPDAVGGVIARIKALFPASEISLGCMRPRTKGLRAAIEMAALEAGVTRMEIPSRETLCYARAQGYEIRSFDACCALPARFEVRAEHHQRVGKR
ncbi:MAG: radical SAM protein [Anaerolineae bacterium]